MVLSTEAAASGLQATRTALDLLVTQVGNLPADPNSLQVQIFPAWESFRTQWQTQAVPALGATARVLGETMMASMSASLQSMREIEQHLGGNQPHAQAFRMAAISSLRSHADPLRSLLTDPPVALLSVGTRGNPATEDALATAKELLAEAHSEAVRRADSLTHSAGWVVAAGIALVFAAAITPFIMGSHGTTGWQLVAEWGIRVLASASFLFGATHAFRTSQDFHGKAAACIRERMMLQALAASVHVGAAPGGAALVDLVRSMTAKVDAKPEEPALVVPEAALKYIPALLEAVKSGSGK